jgi:hypothetical protein
LDAVSPDGFEDGFVEEELIGKGEFGSNEVIRFFRLT